MNKSNKTSNKKVVATDKKVAEPIFNLVVDLNNTNLAVAKEVDLAIAKAKKAFNTSKESIAKGINFNLSKYERKLIKVDNRWIKRVIRNIKKFLGWK